MEDGEILAKIIPLKKREALHRKLFFAQKHQPIKDDLKQKILNDIKEIKNLSTQLKRPTPDSFIPREDNLY